MGETLLVKDHENKPYIAKCYPDTSMCSKTSEGELLKNLRHSGLPSFVEEIRTENMICVVRQYVRGVPLNRLPRAAHARSGSRHRHPALRRAALSA